MISGSSRKLLHSCFEELAVLLAFLANDFTSFAVILAITAAKRSTILTSLDIENAAEWAHSTRLFAGDET